MRKLIEEQHEFRTSTWICAIHLKTQVFDTDWGKCKYCPNWDPCQQIQLLIGFTSIYTSGTQTFTWVLKKSKTLFLALPAPPSELIDNNFHLFATFPPHLSFLYKFNRVSWSFCFFFLCYPLFFIFLCHDFFFFIIACFLIIKFSIWILFWFISALLDLNTYH